MPSKLPLFHWLVVAAARVAGTNVTEYALRLPSLVSAGLVVLLVFLAGARWSGPRVGALAALVLATTPAFIAEASNGRVDMTLLAPFVGAQIALMRAIRNDGEQRLPPLRARHVSPPRGARQRARRPRLGRPHGAHRAGAGTNPRAAARLIRPLPVLVFLLIAGSWYGLAYLHRGWDFVAKQIVSENEDAFLGGERIPYRSMLYYAADASGRARVAVGRDPVDRRKDRLFHGGAAALGPTGQT
jgi:4-amino-4-deoxy-L-arabinose transferase-like glycosyltransferase